jgi:hypothetical protein
MNEKPKGIGSISLLLFTAVLSVWLGVAGPLFGHRPWIHIRDLMEKWQTLVAALVALSAAWWAARPVQKQLAEQRREPAAAATMIAKSAIALEDERADLIGKRRPRKSRHCFVRLRRSILARHLSDKARPSVPHVGCAFDAHRDFASYK